MSEIIKEQTGLSVLGELEQEARYYSRSAINNMIQLGRVLTEAKPLVKHGAWEKWLMDNAGCSPRYAQSFMQAYQRFGDNADIQKIGERGKVFKLLALPEGQEEQFIREHDVQKMTCKEIDEAVKAVKEELNRERQAREEAENQISDLLNRPPEIPTEVRMEIEKQAKVNEAQKAEIARLADVGRQALEEQNRLMTENNMLQREIAEREEMLEEVQGQYNNMRQNFLDAQSVRAAEAAIGDGEAMTTEAFAGAVRQFIGSCAAMPHMQRTFSAMSEERKQRYADLLSAVESWAKQTRQALGTIFAD